MKIQQVPSLICGKEGKKSQVKIGDAREVLRVLRDLCHEDVEVWYCVSDYLRYGSSDRLKVIRKVVRTMTEKPKPKAKARKRK